MPHLLAQPDLPQPATFAEWYVDDGPVDAGQLLYRVECDCLSVDVESEAAAVIERLLGPGSPLHPGAAVADLHFAATRSPGIVELEAARPRPAALESLAVYFESPPETAPAPEVAPVAAVAPPPPAPARQPAAMPPEAVAVPEAAPTPEWFPAPAEPIPAPPAWEPQAAILETVVPELVLPEPDVPPAPAAPAFDAPEATQPAAPAATLDAPAATAVPQNLFLRTSARSTALMDATSVLSRAWGPGAPGILEFAGFAAAAAIARGAGATDGRSAVALRDRGHVVAVRPYTDGDSFRTFLGHEGDRGGVFDCVVSSLDGTGILEAYPALVSGCGLALTVGEPDRATSTVAISLAFERGTMDEPAAIAFLHAIRHLLEHPHVLLAG